jgi:hypothetical protein
MIGTTSEITLRMRDRGTAPMTVLRRIPLDTFNPRAYTRANLPEP